MSNKDGDSILVAFRSPYDTKLMVRVAVPQGLTVSSLREASANAALGLSILRGKATFDSYPMGQVGTIGLLVLSRSMPEEDVERDDPIVSGMLGAISFARQTMQKIQNNVTIPRKEFDQAVEAFGEKFGIDFYKLAVERLRGLMSDIGKENTKRLGRIIEIVDDIRKKKVPQASPEKKPRTRSRSRDRDEKAKEEEETPKKPEEAKPRSRSRSRSRERKASTEPVKPAEEAKPRSRSRSRSRERKDANATASPLPPAQETKAVEKQPEEVKAAEKKPEPTQETKAVEKKPEQPPVVVEKKPEAPPQAVVVEKKPEEVPVVVKAPEEAKKTAESTTPPAEVKAVDKKETTVEKPEEPQPAKEKEKPEDAEKKAVQK